MNPRQIVILALCCLTGAAVILAGCAGGGDGCSGLGTLSITNTSYATEQAVQIDGVGYGTIFPGETILIDVVAGTHTVYTPGVSGGFGCAPVVEVVYECETVNLTCAN